MFPAKINIGQITVVFGIVIASAWGATQWIAAALGFQERLGAPWFLVVGYPVYLPWRLRSLEDENTKLKRLLADAMLDNAALKDLVGKKR